MKEIKNQIIGILRSENISDSLLLLDEFPVKKVLSPVFAALLNPDPLIRWHAVTAMGHLTDRLAGENIEEARVVMRRLMWSLNDESGGIGWGAPECMGEIMARNAHLTTEFHTILFSYIAERDDGADNYLEYLPLRRGAFWGIARLAQSRPGLAKAGWTVAVKALEDERDAYILTCLCLFFKHINKFPQAIDTYVRSLASAEVEVYLNMKFQKIKLAQLCTVSSL
ncbi:DVU0298 family protein [Desulfonatronovibrio magnus]|uniref:DVU0298 family protein n=1 Tax=Desulfonatronovibrio magnus TaxID=698827 RepID=UPI0012FCB78F|nr:DVU0298 family protein [Desulfonatronovibrio magnus]